MEERGSRPTTNRKFRAGMEAIPAKPEQTRSERDQRHVMRLVRHLLAAAYVEHRCECREPGRVMHHDTAGKVKNTPLRKNAIWTPHHVDERKVHEDEPTGEE